MYIRCQDENRVIDFDHFQELMLNPEKNEICAVAYEGLSKISVVLGRYGSPKAAEEEFENCLEAILDYDCNIYEMK